MGAPAAASLGIADLLRGSPRPGVILGTTSDGGWLDLGGHVIVLTGPRGVHLPNEVSSSDLVFPQSDGRSTRCVAGNGHVRLGDVDVDVVRWWDPRPSLNPVTTESLDSSCKEARALLECGDQERLAAALLSGDAVALRRATRELLGKGQGLTPEGDDVLVGVFAGLRLLGPAADAPHATRMLETVEPLIYIEAPFGTTSLSASLLRHAAAGEVAAPVAGLFQALTGRGSLEDAVAEIRTMGATSGTATACGALLVADALAKGAGV